MKHLPSTLALLLATTTATQAAVVNAPDQGGFRTFQDTTTGLIWLDLDNFWVNNGQNQATQAYTSYNAYLAAIQAAGFVWATVAQVQSLTATLPLTPVLNQLAPEFVGYRNVMSTDWGGEVGWISGLAAEPTSPTTQAFIYGDPAAAVWGVAPQQNFDLSITGGATSPGPSLGGLWAFYSPSTSGPVEVPEPSSFALAGLALLGLVASCRRHATS